MTGRSARALAGLDRFEQHHGGPSTPVVKIRPRRLETTSADSFEDLEALGLDLRLCPLAGSMSGTLRDHGTVIDLQAASRIPSAAAGVRVRVWWRIHGVARDG
jgi:hypothetical protein